MANKQAPSQHEVPSTKQEQMNQSIEPYQLTPQEHAARTSTGTTAPGQITGRVDDRHYNTHWGINE